MVLKTLIDKDTEKNVGTYYFPKTAPGLSDPLTLEEYLSDDNFAYLKRETIRFIYKDICDKDIDKIIKKEKTSVDVGFNIQSISTKDGVLYVQQGEMGIASPDEDFIQYLGSSDATTCHILIIRDAVTGVSGVAHIDSVNASHLNDFIHKLKHLANEKNVAKNATSGGNDAKEGSKPCDKRSDESKAFELFVIGGYEDERGTSEELSMELLKYLMDSREIFLMKILAIGSLNTTSIVTDSVSSSSHNAPILYGAAIQISSGHVVPAHFSYRGPDETIRHLKLSFCGHRDGFSEPYNPKTGELLIPAFSFNPHIENLMYYLNLPDETFLEYMSTSPKVEPPHFVENQKKIFRTAIHHPDLHKDIFPDGCHRVWTFNKGKGWVLKHTERTVCKIIDEEDSEGAQQSHCVEEKSKETS